MTLLRAAVQEEKAILTLQAAPAVPPPPPELAASGVIATRQWLYRLEAVRSIKGSTRASVRQLREAIETMRAPFPAPGRPDVAADVLTGRV
jgi:hypothetical protein